MRTSDTGTPEGHKRLDVDCYLGAGWVVVCGQPRDDDEGHNCDEMGCGWGHVLARLPVLLGDEKKALEAVAVDKDEKEPPEG